MAQLLLQGTNFINFVGFNAWVGTASSVTAVQVTEWEEPQAVIGSYLQRYAYPDFFERHVKNDRRLQSAQSHAAGAVGCLQMRGEYLYTAQARAACRCSILQTSRTKASARRIMTAPVGPQGPTYGHSFERCDLRRAPHESAHQSAAECGSSDARRQ